MRHFLSNIICGFIYKKSVRDKVRTMIRHPQTHEFIRFVHSLDGNNKNIVTKVGNGCRNFIIISNKQRVFKFPLYTDGQEEALREKRIIDTFQKISPIKIPNMRIIKYKNIYVREYEYAKGVLLTEIKPQKFIAHKEYIAKQIANFLYSIGKSDPKEIMDLKPKNSTKPGFLYGWTHNDIGGNFMLDPKTFDITYFIDWENASFTNFTSDLSTAAHHWDKFGYKGFVVPVMAEYAKLYFQSKK